MRVGAATARKRLGYVLYSVLCSEIRKVHTAVNGGSII